MPADLMIDLSSNNPLPDLRKQWDAGYRTLALKATESTTYTWTQGQQVADAWHRFGAEAVVWWYHFGRPGSATAQAAHFLNAIKAHRKPQDRVVLDCEVTGVDGRFADEFFNVVHSALPNTKEEIYGTYYFLRDHGVRPNHEQGLWLAGYTATAPATPPGWRTWDAWQFSQTAVVPGESARVDESHLAKTGEAPAPKTAPQSGVPSWWHRVLSFPPPQKNAGFIVHSTFGRVQCGPDVRHVQRKVGKRIINGHYGRGTRRMVKAWQSAHHLLPDGIVGKITATKMGEK